MQWARRWNPKEENDGSQKGYEEMAAKKKKK
jgi:hypothetical protein